MRLKRWQKANSGFVFVSQNEQCIEQLALSRRDPGYNELECGSAARGGSDAWGHLTLAMPKGAVALRFLTLVCSSFLYASSFVSIAHYHNN